MFVQKLKNWFLERKSIRKSTAAKSAETAHRLKVRDLEQKKKIKKPTLDEWVPTQEELLEEAKLTELENIKSLGNFINFAILVNFISLDFQKGTRNWKVKRKPKDLPKKYVQDL